MGKAIKASETSLTPLQNKVVDLFLANGGNATRALEAAGSKSKHLSSVASKMLQKPHVRQAIRDRALESLNLRMVAKALKQVDHLIDGAQSESVQLQASQDVLDRASIKQKEEAIVPFQGTINIDFSSPSSRDEPHKEYGTRTGVQGQEGGGAKTPIPHATTPPTHPTVIEAEYEEV